VKNKRRNGLIKKAIQLSKMCGMKIYVAMYDTKYDRMVQFLSHPDFNNEMVARKIDRLSKQKSKLACRTFTADDVCNKNDQNTSEKSSVMEDWDDSEEYYSDSDPQFAKETNHQRDNPFYGQPKTARGQKRARLGVEQLQRYHMAGLEDLFGQIKEV